MKKLKILLLFLTLSLAAYSQDFSKVVRASKCEYRNGEWVTISTQYPTDVFVILKDWSVTIGTYKFKTYGDSEKNTYESHVVYTWKCVNSNGDKCLFMMKKFNPEVSTHMLYCIVYETGVMYEYETED
jgi:hypothetical protein